MISESKVKILITKSEYKFKNVSTNQYRRIGIDPYNAVDYYLIRHETHFQF